MREAAHLLFSAGVPSPRVDAELLLAAVLGVDRVDVVRRRLMGHALAPAERLRFDELVSERRLRVPVQHLTGSAGFAGFKLAVGPGVFVPRPESEVLVHRARAMAAAPDVRVVVDLCTGSGAIAIALAAAAPGLEVYAVELSAEAAAWAAANIEALGVDVRLRCGPAQTAFPELVGSVDVVTCNPPYIPDDAVPVDPEVRHYDPPMALYGGSADGLSIPLTMAQRAGELLRPGGHLLIEHGCDQGQPLWAALERSGWWRVITDHRDLNERPRVLEAVRG